MLTTFTLFATCLLTVTTVYGAPLPKHEQYHGIDYFEDAEMANFHPFALQYFNEFGYLRTERPTEKEYTNAVKNFQDLVSLEKTGILTEDTLQHMKQPRCGNSDVMVQPSRKRRFLFIGRWENKIKDNVLRLKWWISNYTRDMPKEEIRRTVKKAFKLWSDQIPMNAVVPLSLIFDEASSQDNADINILWAEGDHGDAHKFDGPGNDSQNVLAHTFYPNLPMPRKLNGDIHFDDYEFWHADDKSGATSSLIHVLVHEIGHTLGIGHSKKQKAIMYPVYQRNALDLDLDDKCAIHWNYVGASEMCFFIFLMSDIIPKKIEPFPKDYIDNNLMDFDNKLDQPTSKALVKAHLRNTPVPQCTDDNKVRHHFQTLLQKRLGFPEDLAGDYGKVVCRFLEGIHNVFHAPVTTRYYDTFRTNAVHNYQSNQFDHLRKPEIMHREYDREFFDKLITEFVK